MSVLIVFDGLVVDLRTSTLIRASCSVIFSFSLLLAFGLVVSMRDLVIIVPFLRDIYTFLIPTPLLYCTPAPKSTVFLKKNFFLKSFFKTGDSGGQNHYLGVSS